MSSRDGKTIDLAAVFPAKGDSRRPPDWWGRALLYVAIAVFLSVFVWRSWGKVDFVVLDVIIALFIALAIEPLVIRLVRHGW
ncbi:MAG: AI-2E family transporter, partial [Bifidobacterium mongoliense]|nr:AI-2E family transporter [Bifidobacterium mongoliense]